MKYFGVIALVIAAACVATTYAQAHNATWGNVGFYDSLLYRDIIIVKSKWLQKVSQDVIFPKKGVRPNKTIAAIKAFDQKQNGNGAYATLKQGGPNYNYTTIHLESQRGHGINFIIEIYGR